MTTALFSRWLLNLYFATFAVGAYFVLLNNNQTLEDFLEYDTTYPVAEQVQRYIETSYRVGDAAIISGDFPEKHLDRLRRCPLVSEVAPSVTFQAYDVIEQTNAPRHLVALSNKEGHTSPRDSYFFDDDAMGQDVNVYVIDGGIGRKGPEFGERIIASIDFTNDKLGVTDFQGHGTHVSGIIGSKTFGVAKRTNIIILKVLDKNGQGSLSLIISALEFAVNHHHQSGLPGVANLSLGTPYSSIINRVVDSVSNAGLFVVVAAGNASKDACLVSPASAKSAITVGAIDDRTDRIADFSNWGPCVDIYASGVDVASVSSKKLPLQRRVKHKKKGLHVYSGTSMATPIVTGLVANLLSLGVSLDDVKEHLLSMAKANIPDDDFAARPNTPNRVVYNGCDPKWDFSDEESR